MKDKIHNGAKLYVKRTPLFTDEPQTLGELFLYAVKNHFREDALNYKEDKEWKPISSAEMLSRIENIAMGLHAIGVRQGEKISILAANSPEWTITDAGCQLVGIVDVPIYTTLSPKSIQYIINDSGAKVFFLQNRETYEYIEKILPNCASLEKLVFFEAAGVLDDRSISLNELEKIGQSLKLEKPDLIKELSEKPKPNDVATLIYTSGTTGKPKGVMLSHQNLLSNAIDAGEKYSFTPEDTPLSVLPLSHVFERTGMYLYILNGMAVHYAESIEKVPENLKEVKPTIFVGVPRIFEKVYAKAKLKSAEENRIKEKIFDWAIETGREVALRKEKKIIISKSLALKHNIADKLVYSKLRNFFGGNLRFCITGGAALSDSIYLIFMGAGIPIMQGYGLTETSPVISSNNPDSVKLGTVGKPIRNVKVRIAEDGEIETSGPNVMIGYYNKPEATNKAFTNDGWFKTGDIGKLDEDNFLQVTDRKKELFKTSGGKYIAPSPIEQKIKGSRFVNQVALIGNNRKFVSALIVPNFEQLKSYAKLKNIEVKDHAEMCVHPEIVNLFERQIDKECTELARFETVKKIVLLPEELTVENGELTPTLKIKRRVVDSKYQKVIDKIYAAAEKHPSAD